MPITLRPHDAPPSFEESTNPRQKVRKAGLSPDYWYAVEYDGNIKPGQVVEVTFWGHSIALYRGEDGTLRAMENRCAHRQLKLHRGEVSGCNLVCDYHGWVYDPEGRVIHMTHDLFGRPLPSLRIATYPVKVRYGLIWIFFGDPELAEVRRIPEIPELEGANRWACVPVDFTWRAHHSMIIDNVSDFTHAYLHRKYKPFDEAKLTHVEMVGDNVYLSYDTKVGGGRFSGAFVDRKRVNTNQMDLCFEYPYQWSNTDGKIKHWLFILPIDEQTTRAFFLFYFDALKIPLTDIKIPQRVLTPVLKIANRLLIKPLLQQDGVAVEAEQEGYLAHHDAPIAEFNPAVHLFQQVIIRKWEEHLAKERARGDRRYLPVRERAQVADTSPVDASSEAAPPVGQPAGV
ncbi:MAG TPA: aromatic ring-hydroxylating dioxygenase subunit alpha [Chloroflexota bacterium]|nr:aromatic ring-hydroxylating dioxygenase subunit alpha [Chloroflexota bacterium]